MEKQRPLPNFWQCLQQESVAVDFFLGINVKKLPEYQKNLKSTGKAQQKVSGTSRSNPVQTGVFQQYYSVPGDKYLH